MFGRRRVSHLTVATVLWSMLVVSVGLTISGFGFRSWRLLWFAALLAILFTAAAALSIGPFTLLLVTLQLAGAVAVRRSVNPLGWVALLAAAALIWFLVVPFQLFVIPFLPLFLLVPLGLASAIAATLIAPPPAGSNGK